MASTHCEGPLVAKHTKALGPQIGLRLSRIMNERGLTDRAVADEAHVSFATIQNLRRGLGGQAGLGTVYNVAKALQVRPAWLAYGDEPQVEPESAAAAVLDLFGRLPVEEQRALRKKLD